MSNKRLKTSFWDYSHIFMEYELEGSLCHIDYKPDRDSCIVVTFNYDNSESVTFSTCVSVDLDSSPGLYHRGFLSRTIATESLSTASLLYINVRIYDLRDSTVEYIDSIIL